MIRIPNEEMKESEKKCDFYSKFFDHQILNRNEEIKLETGNKDEI